MDSLALIKKELRKLGNPAKARLCLRFFKTGPGEYGEGDKFLGVTMPQIRKIVKKYWARTNLREVEKLLHSSWHEQRMAAILILTEKFRRADMGGRGKIYRLYLRNIKKYINNWDLVDVSSQHIVGAYLNNRSRTPLYKLARSKNLWERRVAILSTFWYNCQGESADTFKVAEILLADNQDLIHKAVGWMLREVGKRCSLDLLEAWLKYHAKQMSRTMLRYAIEKFPEGRRLYWLNIKSV